MTNQLNIQPVVDIVATLTDATTQDVLILTHSPSDSLIMNLTPVIKGDKGAKGEKGDTGATGAKGEIAWETTNW